MALVAGGLSMWGVRPATWGELVQEAGSELFAGARNLDPKNIDSLFVGAAQPERLAFQSHVAPMVAELLGVHPTRFIRRVELACASGQTAIHDAYTAIASGLSDVALVVGVEKMNLPSMPEATTAMANVLDRAWDGVHGGTAPPFFAMVAQRHMLEYGTTAEQMATVSVKNHRFANSNPKAQFYSKTFSKEKLLSGPFVSPPLRIGDCSSMTDGAGAVLLVGEELARNYSDTPAWVAATSQYSDFHNLANMPSLTDWVGLRRAAQELYARGRTEPSQIPFAEVHDCFTISEIVEYEALGFCPIGSGGRFAAEGQSDLGGKVVVNPRGGAAGMWAPARRHRDWPSGGGARAVPVDRSSLPAREGGDPGAHPQSLG